MRRCIRGSTPRWITASSAAASKIRLRRPRPSAQVALQVLRGEPADSIPPVTHDLNVVQVDSRQLRRWAISESRVPTGTIIRFREPTLWDRYASYIIVAAVVVFAQSALIGGLLIQHNRRRQAEAQVLKNQVELRQSYDRIRDLGARLLHAQESERSRVARDLHDDISQQMALLEIDLEQLAGVVARERRRSLTAETLHRAQEIGRSVHDLSHRLHPAKLRLIGLVAALKGCGGSCRNRNSRSRSRTRMFRRRSPRTWRSASSGSSRKRCTTRSSTVSGRHVSVELHGGPAGLTLTIVDDGVGFDVNTTWRKGLGLISMRERLEAVGGSLEIHSRPGAGTRLEAAVPVPLDPEIAAPELPACRIRIAREAPVCTVDWSGQPPSSRVSDCGGR